MYKKKIVWAYLIVLSLGTILSLYIPKNEVAAKDAIVIPGQAIRLRILANSDLDSDQALKRKVRDKVNEKISIWVKDLTSIKEARKEIESKLPEIQTIAEKTVKENGSDQKVKVKFGEVQFPTKLYGQFLYPAGDYEAVLITLGEGKGANWWCVLFPPLCFLDFSNGVAVSKGFEDKKAGSSSPKTSEQAPEPESVQDSVKKQPVQNPESVSEQSDFEQDNASQNEEADQKTTENNSVKTQQTAKTSPDTIFAAKSTGSQSEPPEKKHKSQAPVYTAEDEQPVKVKFFAVELWERIF